MRFHLTASQKEYFLKNQLVELEAMVGVDLAEAASQAIDSQLSDLGQKESYQAYLEGRDLWRKNPVVKKLSTLRSFAQVMAQLTNQKRLCLAYDQLLRTGCTSQRQLPFEEGRIVSLGSMQAVVGALIVRLSKGSDPTTPYWLPHECGSVMALSPQIVLRLVDLYQPLSVNYLLIAYVGPRAVYIHNPKDPHTHTLKALGYGFGDCLKEETHPTLVRA